MKLCDGKYEFKMDGPRLVCLRHGEPWREFVGDNAILSLFRHAEELERLVLAVKYSTNPSEPAVSIDHQDDMNWFDERDAIIDSPPQQHA